MKPRCRSATLAPARQFGHEALHIRHDAVARGLIALADWRNVPLFHPLTLSRADVAAKAYDPRGAVEVVEYHRPGTRGRGLESVSSEPFHCAGRKLRIGLRPGRDGADRDPALFGKASEVC